MAEKGEAQPATDGERAAEGSAFSRPKRYRWWIQLVIYSIFVLFGQSVGTLLGRIYFEKGGKSEWLQSLVQAIGFPILIPFQWFHRTKKHPLEATATKPSPSVLGLIYIGLGVFVAEGCMLYSIGTRYLPVTTFTLICATQLGFNSIFSYFINHQKFTPYIVNSVVLLTISSILLVFQPKSGDAGAAKTSNKKYIIGFMCTLVASASWALMLSLTQLAFHKVIKEETLKNVIELSIYECLVACVLLMIGVFASGDWRKLSEEMKEFQLGKVSYVMTLFWTAVAWQVFQVGNTGLIFKVSALFSHVVGIFGLPIGPILAVIVLNDKFTGLKGISMGLAMWGFVSYMYEYYLDHVKMKRMHASDAEAADQPPIVCPQNTRNE